MRRLPKIFGRNKGRPLPSEYEDEIERVLGAVTYISDHAICDMKDTLSVVHEDHFAPFDSIFQETAWHNDYSEIMTELCRINSKVVFA